MVGNGNEGAAQLKGKIALRVLHRVTRLVRRYADGCGRSAAVHRFGQADHICLWVVMVGQIAGNTLDAHIGQSVCIQNPARRVRTGDAVTGGHGGIFFEGALYPCAAPD